VHADNRLAAVTDHDGVESIDRAQLFLPIAVLSIVLVLNGPGKYLVFCNDDEQREIDREYTFAQDSPLSSSLSFSFKERVSVLKVVAIHNAPESLSWWKRRAVSGVDVSDLAFRDHNERLFVDAILPREKTGVKAAAQ